MGESLAAVVLGLILGSGALLVASPILWPRDAAAPTSRRRPLRGELFRERLVQAGLPRMSLGVLVAVSLILATAAGALSGAVVPVAALSVTAAVATLFIPTSVVLIRAKAHRRATRVVWPDVVDHLTSAVRSGLALPDGVVALAHSGPPLTRRAFAEFETAYRSTGNFSDCLDTLKASLVDPVADRIIETLRMSREVGGHELPSVLRNLAVYLRQDAAIRAEIEARQSWTINAARLGVAAPWIVLLLLASRPEAAAAYNTASGTLMIAGGAALSLLAYRTMLAVGALPEEKRWFG
jgi:tight adherence protein B